MVEIACFYLVILILNIVSEFKINVFNGIFQHSMIAEKIKNSPDPFFEFLKKQNRMEISILYHELVVGKPTSPIQLIMVSNLYCIPRKTRHEKVPRLEKSNLEHLTISVRFVKDRKEFNKEISSTQHLLQYLLDNIYETENESSLRDQMIHLWFIEMDVEFFVKSHSLTEIWQDNEVKYMAELQEKWVEKDWENKTPTNTLNGHKPSSLYQESDLQRTIPELAEHYFIDQNFSH